MSKNIQKLINHIAFVIDASSSMGHLSSQVINLFDNQVKYLASRSKELDQETRVSVYLFADKVSNLVYDIDVMRLPSLSGYYKAYGNTALVDGTLKAIDDLEKTVQLYGDHSFLLYVLTDGAENASYARADKLLSTIQSLKDNWTVATLVPNQMGVHEAKKFGFPAQNISVWDVSAQGMNEVNNIVTKATENYFRGRATGIRSTKNLFQVDTSKLNTTQVKKKLDELSAAEYQVFPVRADNQVIKPFVESWTGKPYRTGSAYYQLSKKELVQVNKQVMVKNKLNGKVYSGLNARQLIGLPDHEVKVEPGSIKEYEIFIGSSSINRKLVKGTELIVLN